MRWSRRRAIALAIAVTANTIGHYFTSLHLPQVHDVFDRLYYLPIILAGCWFGLRGGLLTAAIVSAVLTPHLLLQWRHTPMTNANEYLEMVIYAVVGGLTGALSQREAQQREDLRRANANMEKAYAQLREQSLALVEADEQLRQAERLAAVGELSASMAHEIRNPLGSIRGAAEIFRDSLGPGHKLNEFARILVQETDHLNRYLTQFLHIARPDKTASGSCEVRSAVEHVLELAREGARRKGIQVVADLEADLPDAAIPVDALQRVLLNLVLNAMEAFPGPGHVKIGAAAVPCHDESSASAPHLVRLAVTDDGPGIGPELRDRIFEPFFSTKADGTGLGLAICKRTIVGHGGSISVENVEPRGTRFVVVLPSLGEVER